MTLRPLVTLLVICSFAGAPKVSATLVVDTGTPTEISPPWAFSGEQYFAARFSLSVASTINSVESYLNNVGLYQNSTPGTVKFSLHAVDVDHPYVPGAALFSANVDIPPSNWDDFQWRGVYGLGWNVGAGSYWVSFVPDPTFFRGAISYAPMSPLPPEHYALGANGAWISSSYWGWDFVDVPVRVDATMNSVPEAATTALLLAAALGVFVRLARKPIRIG